MILDEPSAALDRELERELIDNLRWKFFGKTLIAITHKPALTAAADHVLYIKDGRVADYHERRECKPDRAQPSREVPA